MTDIFVTTVAIDAPPEAVFDHFVRPELLVTWMGDFARLQADENGLFSVNINGVLIRGHYVALRRPTLVEIAWGQAGNAAMPPGSTHLRIEIEPAERGARLTLRHSGLVAEEAAKHAIGWPHFLDRLRMAAGGGDPGPDPWAASVPGRAD